MERRPGPQGQGGRPNQGRGGQGGRGEGGRDGPGNNGRRRAEFDEDGAPMAPKCDGNNNQGWPWETLKDLWDELSCDSGEAEEGDDVDKDDADRVQNPCRFL